ncbi:MAG: universal stress protein [Gammaproteobacteria bacterium]|nr:universal stress protein [Gammaproteobacteria bacterium]MBU1446831.1 universal stress protein [Gammaproteobacteria bacterium]
MYKRIAVAVDGGDTSIMALNEAVKLAKVMDATLLLLHVCEEIPVVWNTEGMMPIPMEDVTKALVESGKQLLHKDKLRVTEAGINVETRLVEDYSGRIGAVISEEAGQWLADLLVIGTHGRKGLDHLLMGSVAEGVMRTASMPVLLVRGA